MSDIACRLTQLVPDKGFIYCDRLIRRLEREFKRKIYVSEIVDAVIEINEWGIDMQIYRKGELKIRRVV